MGMRARGFRLILSRNGYGCASGREIEEQDCLFEIMCVMCTYVTDMKFYDIVTWDIYSYGVWGYEK